MDLLLDLEAAPGTTLRRRAEHALREAVRSGRLAPGTRLPSTRALAAQLGVSRGVVADAYAQLVAEGYLVARRGGGTRVRATPDGGGGTARPGGHGIDGAVADAPGVVLGAHRVAAPVRHDLRPALPALDGFPRRAWLAAAGRVLRTLPDERLGYPDPAGAPELRATLAAYLGRVRGVRATPAQVVVTAGLRQALDVLWAALGRAGTRRVAHETPGWRGWRETAVAAGLDTVGVPVDGDGAAVDRLATLGADAVGVTPAHQFPLGSVLAPERRARLVAWARRTGAVVIEDDYDAEFRFDRTPIGSLQGLAPDVVVYAGTASKTLAPTLRIGWLVVPERFVATVVAEQRRRGSAPTTLDQLVLADLIERGELDRHLRRQRRRYRWRRDALLAALAEALPEIEVGGVAAGLHAVLWLPAHLDEAAVLAEAHERGVALDGLGGDRPALVVGYANLAEAAAPRAVAALAAAVRSAGMPGRDGRTARARERPPRVSPARGR